MIAQQHTLAIPFAFFLYSMLQSSDMHSVSPQDSGSSAESQSAGAATGEASAQRRPFSRTTPRRQNNPGWTMLGRGSAVDSIGNANPKIAHENVFLGECASVAWLWWCAVPFMNSYI